MVLNFVEALIPLMIRGEKTQAARIHRGYGPVTASQLVSTRVPAKIRHNESRVDDERELLRVASSLQDILLTEELFKLNPEYDEANRRAQPKMMSETEALYSSDETDMLGSSPRKGKKDVCVFLHTLDDQNVATTKTNFMAHGRCGDGSMLSPLIAGGIKILRVFKSIESILAS